MARVIEVKDYSLEIYACIAELKFRMAQTCTPCEDDDILVLCHGDDTHILANPILGNESIYDEFGRVVDHIPLHNITLIWQEDWLRSRVDSDCLLLEAICPRLRVLRPELCIRLRSTGKVVGELPRIIEEEEVVGQTENIARLLEVNR